MEPADWIDRYARGVELLRNAIGGMTDDQLHVRPVPGKWSTLEVVCHLVDFEPIYADRMKRVIASEPTLIGADPDESRRTFSVPRTRLSRGTGDRRPNPQPDGPDPEDARNSAGRGFTTRPAAHVRTVADRDHQSYSAPFGVHRGEEERAAKCRAGRTVRSPTNLDERPASPTRPAAQSSA